MKTEKLSMHLFVIALVLAGLACSVGAPSPTATPIPTNTVLPPTYTPKPTKTPQPTNTPDIVATQKAEDLQTLLETFKEKGYLEDTEGEVIPLNDFKQEWAQINYYRWWNAIDEEIGDFVFTAHFEWSTASSNPEISGCGIVFGVQENEDHYAVILDKGRTVFLMGRGPRSYEVGVTRGSGRMDFGNPAEADFAVLIQGQRGVVSVKGIIAEYTLSVDQTSSGYFAYTILSGTNREYGTRCEISNAQLWLPK